MKGHTYSKRRLAGFETSRVSNGGTEISKRVRDNTNRIAEAMHRMRAYHACLGDRAGTSIAIGIPPVESRRLSRIARLNRANHRR